MKRLHSINSVVLSISLLSLANAAFAANLSEAIASAEIKANDTVEAIRSAFASGDYAQAEVLTQELGPVTTNLQALQQEAAAGKLYAFKKACTEAFNNTQDRIRGSFATSKTACYNQYDKLKKAISPSVVRNYLNDRLKVIAGHPYIACGVVGTGIATYIIWKRYKQAKQQGAPFIPSYITEKINKTMTNAKSTSKKIASKIQYS